MLCRSMPEQPHYGNGVFSNVPFSWTTLQGKYPIAVMRVVDMSWLAASYTLVKIAYFANQRKKIIKAVSERSKQT